MGNPDLEDQMRRASEVQAKYADHLMSLPHVVGVGIGFAYQRGVETPEVALIVMVDEKVPEAQLEPDQRIPARLDGVRVDVQPAGVFTAFSSDDTEDDG